MSALYEQLKAPRVQRFMEVYSRVDYSFEYLRQDLGTFYMEAKDNVRFLSTLERHFKNVTHGASFQSVRNAASCRAPWAQIREDRGTGGE